MADSDKYFLRNDAELPNICGNCDKKTQTGVSRVIMVCSESDKTVEWNGTCPGYK
jgi:hypothetical protein